MNRKYLMFLILGLLSCSTEETETPTTPNVLYDIKGSVNLFDEGVKEVSNSDMIVSIVGSDPQIFSTTDDNGDFILAEVEKGTYTLSFEKSGFGVFKLYNLEHNSNESTFITNNPSLGEKSTTSVSLLRASVSHDTLILNTTLDQNANIGNPRYVRVFFGTNSDLSPEKYDYYSPAYIKRINPFMIKYTSSELIAMGFQKGQKVYVNVAGDSFYANDYYDPDLERQIFPNLFWTDRGDNFIVP